MRHKSLSLLLCTSVLSRPSCAFVVLLRPSSRLPKTKDARSTSLRTALQMRGGVDIASDAVALFNNMKGPASMITGAIVPLGFLAPLPPMKDNTKNDMVGNLLRRMHVFTAVSSLSNMICSIMWATVACNQLTETEVPGADSVFALIKGEYALPWTGTNAHFLLGLLGFMWMIGTRAYLAGRTPLGIAAAGTGLSGLLLSISIVNRGVASGGGAGTRIGPNILWLLARYVVLLSRQATSAKSFGPLEIVAISLGLASTALGVWGIFFDDSPIVETAQ